MPPRKRNTRSNPTPPEPENPAMNSAAIETLVAQRVAEAMASLETNRNNGNGQGTTGSSHGNHSNPRVCTYKNFQSCKPRTFHGNEGAIRLTRWVEKTESVFQISLCLEEYKVRFAASTFADIALTW